MHINSLQCQHLLNNVASNWRQLLGEFFCNSPNQINAYIFRYQNFSVFHSMKSIISSTLLHRYFFARALPIHTFAPFWSLVSKLLIRFTTLLCLIWHPLVVCHLFTRKVASWILLLICVYFCSGFPLLIFNMLCPSIFLYHLHIFESLRSSLSLLFSYIRASEWWYLLTILELLISFWKVLS